MSPPLNWERARAREAGRWKTEQDAKPILPARPVAPTEKQLAFIALLARGLGKTVPVVSSSHEAVHTIASLRLQRDTARRIRRANTP